MSDLTQGHALSEGAARSSLDELAADPRPPRRRRSRRSHQERGYYSPREYVEITGLSEPTVKRLLRSGEIPSFKIGARRLIPRSALPGKAQ